jgi:pimeloyl-ACP methyl ester carboxylesterase
MSSRSRHTSLPVYFLHGIYDYTFSYALAKSYYKRLETPLKGFYTFTMSAHSPCFEEPGRMREIGRDILTGSKDWADPEQDLFAHERLHHDSAAHDQSRPA